MKVATIDFSQKYQVILEAAQCYVQVLAVLAVLGPP
jgi:hypothetical protein